MKAPDPITIREVQREDAEWKARFLAFFSGYEVKKLGRKTHAYFAAYSGDEIVGHSVIYLEKGRWVMDGLRVNPEFREMGIAKRLTEARLRHAIERDAKEVWYACEDGNLVTICCHMRFGFKKVCPDSHRCTVATAHWYRLNITPVLLGKFPALRS